MPLTGSAIEIREINLAHLAGAAAGGDGCLQISRHSHKPLLLLTRLRPLPWASAMFVSPVGRVWSDFPAGTTAALHVPQFPTCGPNQSTWIARIASDRALRRRFKQAIDAAGVVSMPRGVLGFDGGILFGTAAIGIDRRQPPLWPGWYRAFLLPDVDRSLALLLQAADAILTERKDFALRPITDEAVMRPMAAEPYSLADDRPEAFLFSQIYADPHPLGKPPEVATRIVAALRRALSLGEGESSIELGDCSVALSPSLGLNLPIADYSYSSVMDLPRRWQDEIVSLRVEVVHRLGWPVFARQMLLARQQVLTRRSSRRPFDSLAFDPLVSIDAYIQRVGQAHPTSLRWPFDEVWAQA